MITSRANPKVKQVAQWQNGAGERREAGIFLAEGFKMFEEAPEKEIREVYITEEACGKAGKQPSLWEKLCRTGYEVVSPEVFDRMSDTRSPQGILCVVNRREHGLEELLSVPDPLLVLLESLQDPGNLGTIIRTAEGAGVTGVIVNRETVDLYNPKVIRSTMGSVYRVPVVCAEDLSKTADILKKRGVRVYAAHLAGKKSYDSLSYKGGTAFLIGNEGRGLSEGLTKLADEYLRIPMEGQVESLNASVAAALLMYEAHRSRSLS